MAPADAGPVYYAQDITVINPPREADWGVLSSDGIYQAAIAQALGLLDRGLDSLRDAVNDSGQLSDEELRQRWIREFRLDESKPADLALIESLLSRREPSGDELDWIAAVSTLGLEGEDLEDLGSECLEVSLALEPGSVASDSRVITIADLVSMAGDSPLRATYTTRYPRALNEYGFEEVALIREFPIARIVAGYTREENKAAERPADSPKFHFFDGEGGRKAMYGQRSVTESLYFQLEADRIVRWLQDSGLLGDIGDTSSRAWLFTQLQPVTSIFDEPDDLITAAVLGLLHSISHRVIMSLTDRSGLKADSLTERILPYNGAFLIYPGARSDFVLGGLEHVFRNYLDECLRGTDEETRCVFDPPCRNRAGACAVCMFLSEVTCERFNTALSRHYLFGGESRGVRWKGFWR